MVRQKKKVTVEHAAKIVEAALDISGLGKYDSDDYPKCAAGAAIAVLALRDAGVLRP